jgi:hypothetical protein
MGPLRRVVADVFEVLRYCWGEILVVWLLIMLVAHICGAIGGLLAQWVFGV